MREKTNQEVAKEFARMRARDIEQVERLSPAPPGQWYCKRRGMRGLDLSVLNSQERELGFRNRTAGRGGGNSRNFEARTGRKSVIRRLDGRSRHVRRDVGQMVRYVNVCQRGSAFAFGSEKCDIHSLRNRRKSQCFDKCRETSGHHISRG